MIAVLVEAPTSLCGPLASNREFKTGVAAQCGLVLKVAVAESVGGIGKSVTRGRN